MELNINIFWKIWKYVIINANNKAISGQANNQIQIYIFIQKFSGFSSLLF